MLRVKSGTESTGACPVPSGGFNGSVTRDDQQIGVNLSWDLFNRNASYGVTEKAAQIVAATGRLDSVARMIDETGRLSLITVRQSRGKWKRSDVRNRLQPELWTLSSSVSGGKKNTD